MTSVFAYLYVFKINTCVTLGVHVNITFLCWISRTLGALEAVLGTNTAAGLVNKLTCC